MNGLVIRMPAIVRSPEQPINGGNNLLVNGQFIIDSIADYAQWAHGRFPNVINTTYIPPHLLTIANGQLVVSAPGPGLNLLGALQAVQGGSVVNPPSNLPPAVQGASVVNPPPIFLRLLKEDWLLTHHPMFSSRSRRIGR